MRPADRYEFFRRLRAANPHPTTELVYSTPFELLISVVLSAQATDVGVNKATARLYPVANTPETILALGEDGLVEYINTIGLFRSKARHIMGLCQMLIEQHNGQVPHDRAALEALPGVGRKPRYSRKASRKACVDPNPHEAPISSMSSSWFPSIFSTALSVRQRSTNSGNPYPTIARKVRLRWNGEYPAVIAASFNDQGF